jgi:hypothetical protein
MRGRAGGRPVLLGITAAVLVCGMLGVSAAAGSSSGPIKGALYKSEKFAGDPFELRVSKDGRTAHLVGQFEYTDPGCPGASFGNTFLTAANAPTVTISSNGDFSGSKNNSGTTDTISGVFHGSSAPTQFKETESCPGDTPLVINFTLKSVPVKSSPILGKTVLAARTAGTVLIERPGSRRFVALAAGKAVPLGSVIDADHGTVQLTAATTRSGGIRTGQFHSGTFRVTQTRAGGTELTVLTLTAELTGCSAGHHAGDAGASRKPPKASRKPPKKVKSRSLWGSATGSFQTVGRYASATERGTKWLTEDTCTATIIHVSTGAVRVVDFPHHKTVLVKAPHTYSAHPGRGG